MDGNGVVTPRDVIDLLTTAKRKQLDECAANLSGQSDHLIGSSAIVYGLGELSRRKRQTYLEAEFPHLWKHIRRFITGKTEYSIRAFRDMFGKNAEAIADDLLSIGLLSQEKRRDGTTTFKIPFVYREGLELTQGKVS